jgi:hypothetical protein
VGRVDAEALQVAAEHYVLFLLLRRGHEASSPAAGGADILACSADGFRVALLRVQVLEGSELRLEAGSIAVARNRAYVCVELLDDEQPPRCYVVPSVVFGKVAVWTKSTLAPYLSAWHLLGLQGSGLRAAS